MAESTFTCTVITPESTVLNSQATSAVIPANDGEIGVLYNRAPMLCRLGVGVMRLETPAGPRKLFIDAGFAQVLDNKLTVLTDAALSPEKIDAAATRTELEEARNRRAVTDEERETRQHDIARASAKLKAASAT